MEPTSCIWKQSGCYTHASAGPGAEPPGGDTLPEALFSFVAYGSRGDRSAPMRPNYDLVVHGGMLVGLREVAAADIGVRNGKIAEIGSIAASAGADALDASGLHILPGCIDSHVHFRTPGFPSKETFETGSAAALRGGICTVFDMPNTDPPLTEAAALEDRFRLADGTMHVDFAFWAGAARTNLGWLQSAELERGVAGVKLFMGASTGDLLVEDDAGIRAVLSAGKRRVAVHAEDEARLRSRTGHRRPGRPETHPMWRDAEAARLGTERLIRLARAAGRPVHVLHVSTREEIPLLRAARGIATAEATPHHLTFAAEEVYSDLGSRVQVNPPIRGREHRDALFAALRDGLFDTIGSDHAPHTLLEKAEPYPASPSGFPGVATTLPIMLEHAAAGRLSLPRLAGLLSSGPARVFGILGKGFVSAGYDADLTLVDLRAVRQIENSRLVSRVGWTPYAGMRVRGWPLATILRGHVAMREGEILGDPQGRSVAFRPPTP